MAIREYRAETDFDGLRRCVVELQDYEYRLDSRCPDGDFVCGLLADLSVLESHRGQGFVECHVELEKALDGCSG